MRHGAISQNTAAGVVIIGTVLFATVVFAMLSGLTGSDGLGITAPEFSIEVVQGLGRSGELDTYILKLDYIDGFPLQVNDTEIILIDPDKHRHEVLPATVSDYSIIRGDTWYIFYLDLNDPGATDYWLTDCSDMVFSTTYHAGVEPFNPPGTWKIEIQNSKTKKLIFEQYGLIEQAT